MAGTKRHIDQELKAKLGKHTLPVTDSDWTAFEGFRRQKESRRRRVLYWITAASLLFIALSGALVWEHYERPTLTQSEKQAESARNNGKSPEAGIGSTDEIAVKPEAKPENRSGREESVSEKNIDKEDQADAITPSSKRSDPNRPAREDGKTPEESYPEESDIVWEKEQPRFPVIYAENIDAKVFRIPSPMWKWADMPAVLAYQKDEDADTSALPGKHKRIGFPPLSSPAIALGFAYGFGNPSLSVKPIDSAQTHRQYENTLKGAKQSSQVFRFFIQYEYRLKLGLEFGAGLEMSSAEQVQKYNFEVREIPVFDTADNIIHYFKIPAGQYVPPTVFESRQKITSATIPLSVGYSHMFGGTNLRLGVRLRGSLGKNWSKDFKGISPSNLSETTRSANVNPFNMSYGGGLFGEYFYLRTWSARVSLDWTAQNELYRQSNSYNISNHYYEFKLAIVKYL